MLLGLRGVGCLHYYLAETRKGALIKQSLIYSSLFINKLTEVCNVAMVITFELFSSLIINIYL